MKKLFVLTESEKSRILKMHKDAIKRQYLNEDLTAVEPVLKSSLIATFDVDGIPSGTATVDQNEVDTFVTSAANIIKKSCKTLQKFSALDSKFEIPSDMFNVEIGTDSVGDGKDQTTTFNLRRAKAIEIIKRAITDSECNLTDDLQTKLLAQVPSYDRTDVDLNVSNKKPDPKERYIKITIKGITQAGKNTEQINYIAAMLRNARGRNWDPEEGDIKDAFCMLKTYSDIKDLNSNLMDFGGVQKFINDTITSNAFWNDNAERTKIVNCLNAASNNSGKGDVAAEAGGAITLNLKVDE